MYGRTATITNAEGLHARPAAQFAKCAKQFTSKITVSKGDRSADAKSVLGILTLAANRGSEISISAEGEDEEKAVAALADLVSGVESAE
ncbi:MAG: HPr family phosphocarrier protein [Clostridiales Family XIII bacterium]|jgi:phosphotransferase system HPr (HPr) family protein|nr:HPr family phosphocarrier protein [Clostridiales Family XIII bacterium]